MTARSFAEKLGPDLCRKDPIVAAVVTLVERGELHDEEALVLLVKILAAEVESTRAQAIAIATGMPPPPRIVPEPLPASGEPGAARFFRETRSTAMPDHSDNCPCWDCTLPSGMRRRRDP